MKDMRNIAIMGSTGSIGRQTLDIVSEYPDLSKARVLIANNSADLLIEQALADCVTAPEIDTVVTAMVGYSGLAPTIKAIGAGKKIALANKETLVVAGDLITRLLATSKSVLYPVDSEHGAFYQCLVGERHQDINKLILTASGGPFRTFSKEQLEYVTAADALKHPNWSMGAKITIDSATLMNKGLEVIEAMRLYRLPLKQVSVMVHPQSIVHSMVEFRDGAVLGQLGTPDMRLPIQYALTWPHRTKAAATELDLFSCPELTFQRPDPETFRCLGIALECAKKSGTTCAVMNGANEAAVDLFLHDKIGC